METEVLLIGNFPDQGIPADPEEIKPGPKFKYKRKITSPSSN